MHVSEFEQAVLDKEEVVIRIRAPITTVVDDYDYVRQASNSTSVADWLENRILPKLKGSQVAIVDGHGQAPHGRTKLATLRATYER